MQRMPYFLFEREKGNLNIDEIMKNKKEVNSDENITPVKNKGEKESSSSSTETSPSPAKREEQKFVTP